MKVAALADPLFAYSSRCQGLFLAAVVRSQNPARADQSNDAVAAKANRDVWRIGVGADDQTIAHFRFAGGQSRCRAIPGDREASLLASRGVPLLIEGHDSISDKLGVVVRFWQDSPKAAIQIKSHVDKVLVASVRRAEVDASCAQGCRIRRLPLDWRRDRGTQAAFRRRVG